MLVDNGGKLTAEEMRLIRNYEHFLTLLYKMAGLGLIPSSQISIIPQMSKFTIEQSDDEGTFTAAHITKERIKVGDSNPQPVEPKHFIKFNALLDKAVADFEKHNIPKKYLTKHLALSYSTMTYYWEGTVMNMAPITKFTQKYWDMLRLSEDISIIRTRFALRFVYEQKTTAKAALDMLLLPKEWFDELFS